MQTLLWTIRHKNSINMPPAQLSSADGGMHRNSTLTQAYFFSVMTVLGEVGAKECSVYSSN